MGCLRIFLNDLVLLRFLEVSQLCTMVDEVLDKVLDVRRAIAVGLLQRNMFLAVSQSTIADWSAEDDSLDVLLRLGDSIEDLQCWWVADARAAQLIQAVNEYEELAVIQRMFKALPESGLDLAG